MFLKDVIFGFFGMSLMVHLRFHVGFLLRFIEILSRVHLGFSFASLGCLLGFMHIF